MGANLSGSRASQLLFLLLVIGLSLVPGLAALVPVVRRDAHGSVSAGWKETRRPILTVDLRCVAGLQVMQQRAKSLPITVTL